ncbi:probable glycosyl transferase [Calothrix sp. PCC 7716]|nr:probable glycosyl transferase [Calothrix sp. PCC 7716]
MPIISVIIPVYNAQKTIKRTIESVLRQSFTDFELIIINADSTDSTLEIISQIKDSRLQVYCYPKANVAVNRNRGFEHATGEFVTFVDADDLWTFDKLELQYKALLENSNAAVAYSYTDAIDEDDNFLRPCSRASWNGDVFSKLLLNNFIASGSNIMVRSSAFTEVNGFDCVLTNCQDYDLCVRLGARYNFVAVEKVQILYRQIANSMSSNVLGLEKSCLKVIERAFAEEKALPYKHLKKYRLANMYKYLSCKALAEIPGKHNTFQATRLIWQTVISDPTLLLKPIIYKALLKLAIMSLIPPKSASKLLNKFPRLSNTSTFFGYIKVNYRY